MVSWSVLRYYLDIFGGNHDLEKQVRLFAIEVTAKDPKDTFFLIEKVGKVIHHRNVF